MLSSGTYLSSSVAFVKTNQVSKSQVFFKNSWVYNWPFGDGSILTTFQIVSNDIGMANLANEETSLLEGYLNYRFVQHPILSSDHFTREGIAEVVALIGGFIGMMKNIAYIIIGNY